MMKKAFILMASVFMLITLISCSSQSNSQLKDNYKNIKWNTTIEKIKKLEDKELVTNDDKIYFAFYDIYGEQARIDYKYYDNVFSGIDIEFSDYSDKLFEKLFESIKNEYNITYESVYDADMVSFDTKTTTIWLMKNSDNSVSLSFSPLDD